MDSLTHIILGASIGEAVLGKKIGKKAMLWGAVADTLPDLDSLASPFLSPVDALMSHRGISHSFLLTTIMSVLLGIVFSKIYSKYPAASRKDWIKLFFLGMFTHILLDSMTGYGTGLFEPFSHYRVTFNTIFVADPLYTIPFLVCIIVVLAKRDMIVRKRWNRLGLIISSSYLLLTIINKIYMCSVFEDSLKKQGISYSRFMTSPTPLNNVLWTVLAEDKTGFLIGYYSLLDDTKDIKFYHIDRNEQLIESVKEEASVKKLKQFSENYYSITQKDSTIYLNDLRFGQVGGWYNPDTPFAFSFALSKGADNSLILARGRWGDSAPEAFTKLLERIKGI